MVFKWRDNDTDKFLNLYKSYEFLWDIANPLYKNRAAREATYKEIITQMQIPDLSVRDIKNKIKTVRTNYKFELNKVLKSERAAVYPSDIYVPHLFWFKKADAFLRNVSMIKPGSSSLSDCLEEDTSYTLTEDNTTQQSSDFEVCDIKVEDSEVQEEDTNLKNTQINNNISNKRKRSTTPSNASAFRIESVTPPTFTNAMPTVRIPKNVIIPPGISVSKNQLCTSSSAPKSKGISNTENFEAESTNKPKSNAEQRVRKRATYFIQLEKSVSKLQRTLDLRKGSEDDEFDLFGKSIALQLKRMPLERALTCQENLQRVMNQERLRQNK